jgi:tartrate dehydratase beta subunit/fumarate hydratase class I family protein
MEKLLPGGCKVTIFGKEYYFSTPLSEGDVRRVKAGDILYISGKIWSGRSTVLKKFIEEHEPLPIDTHRLNVFFTGGEGMIPAAEKPGFWEPSPLAATLGLRFEKWIPDLIKKAGLRAVITKGNMREGTREACVRFGCVQLTPFGWTVTPHFTDVLKEKVRDEEVYWREAGLSEALIVYHVGSTGPWLVNMDTMGHVFYDHIYAGLTERVKEIYRRINLPQDFSYTSLEQ